MSILRYGPTGSMIRTFQPAVVESIKYMTAQKVYLICRAQVSLCVCMSVFLSDLTASRINIKRSTIYQLLGMSVIKVIMTSRLRHNQINFLKIAFLDRGKRFLAKQKPVPDFNKFYFFRISHEVIFND